MPFGGGTGADADQHGGGSWRKGARAIAL